MSHELNKLTRAQLLALIESGALKPVKAKREKLNYRITSPEKSCIVGTPLKDTHPDLGKGKTFAVWLEDVAGEKVKRRAYDGVSFLVVDTRGISREDIAGIAKAWSPRAKGSAVGNCVVFTKAGK